MRLLLLLLLLSQSALASLSKLARQQLVPDTTGMSFAEIKSTLEAHEAQFKLTERETDRKPFKNGYTKYTLREGKTPVVYVFIPGLYRNPSQFTFIRRLVEPYQQNAIYLNLPGHGRDMYA